MSGLYNFGGTPSPSPAAQNFDQPAQAWGGAPAQSWGGAPAQSWGGQPAQTWGGPAQSVETNPMNTAVPLAQPSVPVMPPVGEVRRGKWSKGEQCWPAGFKWTGDFTGNRLFWYENGQDKFINASYEGVELMNVRARAREFELRNPNHNTWTIRASDLDGNRCVQVGGYNDMNKSILMWDLQSQSKVFLEEDRGDYYLATCFIRGTPNLAICDSGHRVFLWDLEQQFVTRNYANVSGWGQEMKNDPANPACFFLATNDGKVQYFDTRTQSDRACRSFLGISHHLGFTGLCKPLSDSFGNSISGASPDTIILWDVGSGREIKSFSNSKFGGVNFKTAAYYANIMAIPYSHGIYFFDLNSGADTPLKDVQWTNFNCHWAIMHSNTLVGDYASSHIFSFEY